jgi:DNA (cytosine-5)-methyltransferase 1
VQPIFVIPDSDSEDGVEHMPYQATAATLGQPLRNGPISYPLQVLSSLDEGGLKLRPGKSVELKRKPNGKDQFLRIHQIIRHANTNNIELRGHLLFRNRTLGRILRHQRNEIFLYHELVRDDSRPDHIQSMVTVPLDNVKKIRTIIITDEPFPKHSFRDHTVLDASLPGYNQQKQVIKDNDVLVCRYLHSKTWETTVQHEARKPYKEGRVRYIQRDQADELYRSRLQKQEPTPPKPFYPKSGRKPFDFPQKKKIYTYGSGFGGAGGDATGAALAGARIRWSWDENQLACNTCELNHPTVKIYRVRANQFLGPGYGGYVDIYHLSPPCKYFSPAHTQDGKNDDENIAALYVIRQHLEHIKPRIVTMENTFGLKHDANSAFFEDMISMVLEARYNIQWTVDDFRNFGLPANRKRLIVFGAQ